MFIAAPRGDGFQEEEAATEVTVMEVEVKESFFRSSQDCSADNERGSSMTNVNEIHNTHMYLVLISGLFR
jgi:hypothetical protein